MAKAPRKSKSGYYSVQIARAWPDNGFTYSPAHAITADEETLARMQAESGLVLSATPAESIDVAAG